MVVRETASLHQGQRSSMNAYQPGLYHLPLPRALKCATPRRGAADFSRRGCTIVEHGLRCGSGYIVHDHQPTVGCLTTD